MQKLSRIFLLGFALAIVAPAHAGDRTGFKKFAARYDGGYNVVGPDVQNGGASRIIMRSNGSGSTARFIWINTFYDETGVKSNVRTKFTFLPGGTFTANTIDPTRRGLGATGTYTLKNRRITFSATNGDLTTTGTIRLVGGGALTAEVTLGETVVEFHGGRK